MNEPTDGRDWTRVEGKRKALGESPRALCFGGYRASLPDSAVLLLPAHESLIGAIELAPIE